MQISVVCHENIARSQVLGHYLTFCLKEKGLDSKVKVFSCGTVTTPNKYGNEEYRLDEVQQRLNQLGLQVTVKRDWWNDYSAAIVKSSDIIIAAEAARKADIVERLGPDYEPRVQLFYEFIGEGAKDFMDTYDPEKGAQDPERFDRCFNELKRVAKLVVEQLEVH